MIRHRRLEPLALGALGALLVAATLAASSGATLSSHAVNSGNQIGASDPSVYLHLYSQVSDPSNRTGYATRSGSSPATPAATGGDHTLAVNLGSVGHGGNYARTLIVQAPASFPGGVTSITATLSVTADLGSGRQPIDAENLATLTDSSKATSATLTAGQSLQVDLNVNTHGFPSGTYVPQLDVVVTYPGYSGGFFSYQVPVSLTVGG